MKIKELEEKLNKLKPNHIFEIIYKEKRFIIQRYEDYIVDFEEP